jgi:hypothetical protein
MSIEVTAHMFLFLPQQPTKSLDEVKRDHEQNDEVAEVSFIHNHLHDLESLWWVAVWLVFYNHFYDTQQSNEEPLSDLQDVERQLRLARTLFPSSITSIHRQNGFQTSFLKVYNDLPKNKHLICSYLDVLRTYLISHYLKVESTLPHSIDLTASTDDIYGDFRKAFALSQEDFILAFIPDIHIQLRGSLKRARAESTNDSDTGGIASKRRQ